MSVNDSSRGAVPGRLPKDVQFAREGSGEPRGPARAAAEPFAAKPFAARPRAAAAPRGPASGGAPPAVDDIDRRILRELAADGRLANNALAERVGVAASTCLGRVRALRERGVIRGYHADVDPVALGRPIQAMIAVRLQAQARGRISGFAARIARLPEVRNLYFLAGADDFLVHVAAASTEALRDFVVVYLSGNPDVALTETNLIFEHVRSDEWM